MCGKAVPAMDRAYWTSNYNDLQDTITRHSVRSAAHAEQAQCSAVRDNPGVATPSRHAPAFPSPLPLSPAQVLTGEPPRRGALRPLVTPADCLPEVALLFHRCLSQEQQLRPSAAEIVGTLRECSRRWAGEETGAWAPGAAPQPQRPLADVSQMRVVRRVSLARGVMLSPLATPPATGGGGSPFAPSK